MRLTMQNEKNYLVWRIDGSPVEPYPDGPVKINGRAKKTIDYCRADIVTPQGILFDVEGSDATAKLQTGDLEFSSTNPASSRWKKGGSNMTTGSKQTKKKWNADLISPFSGVSSPFQAMVQRDTGMGAIWEYVDCRQVTIILED